MWDNGRVNVEAKVHVKTAPKSGATIPTRTAARSGCLALTVTPDQFFTAMCRARVLRHPYYDETAEYAAISLGQRRHFKEYGLALRLTSSAYHYVDFEDKAFRGRFGNTLGLLAAEALGFRWFAHFKQVRKGFARPYPAEQTPDFLAVSSTGLAALECKGSATAKRPDILWSSMKRAYANQVDPWVAHPFDGTYLNAGIVIGARANQVDAAYVDIIQAATRLALPTPPSVLSYPAQFNYGVWLRLIGLTNVADVILRGEGQATPDHRFYRLFHDGLPYVGIERQVPPSYQSLLPEASVFWSLPGPVRPLSITLPEPIMALALLHAGGQLPAFQLRAEELADRSKAYFRWIELELGQEQAFPSVRHGEDLFSHPDGTLVLSSDAFLRLERQTVEWFQGSFRAA
jgi:hypothetical protein